MSSSRTASSTTAPSPDQAVAGTYVVQGAEVHVHSKPAHGADVMFKLRKGDVVTCEAAVTERNEEWLKLQARSMSHRWTGVAGAAPHAPAGYALRRHHLYGTLLRPTGPPAPAARCPVWTQAEIRELCQKGSRKDLVPPAEAKFWSREQLQSFVESEGAVRPVWPSVPDERLLAGEDMSPEQVEQALRVAASWISRADIVVVVSGLGMSADSGVVTYRNLRRSWPALGGPDMGFEDVCSARLFQENPELAWGFWLHCSGEFRAKEPHPGHSIVHSWAKNAPHGYFQITSNFDGHWLASGWPEDNLLELNGTARLLQCAASCCDEVWPAPEDLGLRVDPATHCAVGELPRCPRCGGVARPCVRMFHDDSGTTEALIARNSERCLKWFGYMLYMLSLGGAMDQAMLLVILELGCGPGTYLRREVSEKHVKNSRARLIRVNSGSSKVSPACKRRAVSVPLGALEALQRMDMLAGVVDRAGFICLDPNNDGAEVLAPANACLAHVLRKASASLGGNVAQVESDGGIKCSAQHVHQRHLKQELETVDVVPEKLFFVRTFEDGLEPPVTCVHVRGLRFGGRSAALEGRVNRVVALTWDLINAFEEAPYQERLALAQDVEAIQKMVRSVHLQVLPRHGFPTAGAGPSAVMQLVLEMQGFLQSGFLDPEHNVLADRTLRSSGYSKIMALSEERRRRALADRKMRSAAGKPKPPPQCHGPTCVVFLRHGQREDYVALGEGWGLEWVSRAARPWDPALASCGRQQGQAAVKRIREELRALAAPPPGRIYTSTLARCIETGDLVAHEFGIESLLLEEGLNEAICEAMMRQWAVPGANANWGGPSFAAMPERATHRYERTVQGPAVLTGLRAEAELGACVLVRTAAEVVAANGPGAARVATKHQSRVCLRQRSYAWGHFEQKGEVIERVLETVRARAAEHPGETLVFVGHGGPLQWATEALTGEPVPPHSGGMTALSVLRRQPGRDPGDSWEAVVVNDARHAKPFHKGPGL